MTHMSWNLQDNYAKWDNECVERVRRVYDKLELQQVFLKFEEETYSEILRDIDQLDVAFNKDVFRKFIDKIYKRKK